MGAHFARHSFVLLGCARFCSLLTWADATSCRWGVVVTILTSEGSLVRTQLRPPGGLHISLVSMFTSGADILAWLLSAVRRRAR